MEVRRERVEGSLVFTYNGAWQVRRPVWSQPVLLTPPFQPDIKRVRFIHGLKYAGILTENLPREEFTPLTYSLFNSKENYLPLYNLTVFLLVNTSIPRKNRRKGLTLTVSFLRTMCTIDKHAGCGHVKQGAE